MPSAGGSWAEQHVARIKDIDEGERSGKGALVVPPAWDLTPFDYRMLVGIADKHLRLTFALKVSAKVKGRPVDGHAALEWLNRLDPSLVRRTTVDIGATKHRSKVEYDRRNRETWLRHLYAMSVPLDPVADRVADEEPPHQDDRSTGHPGMTTGRPSQRPDGAALPQPAHPDPAAPVTTETAESMRSASGEHLGDQWAQAVQLHARVGDAWAEVITDPLNALEHAMLFSTTHPLTVAFIDAYFAANQFRDIHGENWAQARTGDLTADREMVLRYRSLVEKASRAWEAAYKTSSRLEWEDWLPAKEAKRARRAEALLRVAGDESETLHARAAAAQKAATLLKKVTGFLLPEQVERALADGSRLALPGGSRP